MVCRNVCNLCEIYISLPMAVCVYVFICEYYLMSFLLLLKKSTFFTVFLHANMWKITFERIVWCLKKIRKKKMKNKIISVCVYCLMMMLVVGVAGRAREWIRWLWCSKKNIKATYLIMKKINWIVFEWIWEIFVFNQKKKHKIPKTFSFSLNSLYSLIKI